MIVMLIAVFNFVNLTTARAMNRAKEVGVRKVVGAVHKQLIMQFLSESLLMTLQAVIIALFLSGLFLPVINEIAGKSLDVPLHEPTFLCAILLFTLIVGLLSGIYPAFYLARFKPTSVLKGFLSGQPEQVFRRVLVVSQFTLSLVLIAGTIIIYKQLQFIQNKHLGFDQSQLLYVEFNFDARDKATILKTDLEEHTSIAGVTATSSNLVDERGSTNHIDWEGRGAGDEFVMSHVNVDPDFLSTTGMSLAAGRNFDATSAGDTSRAYLINETAARSMGWTPEQAIGKQFTFWDTKGQIIGVVKDFHFRPMTTGIAPILFRCWPKAYYAGLFVKTKAGRAREAIALIEKTYKKYDQESAPSYEFMDEALENQYRTEQNTARIVLYFSTLAIVVSCLGLFGLATYTAEKRTKEIGIRKVLGASVSHVVLLLSRDFLKLVLLSILIASPIAWYAMHQWLENFAYSTAIEWWIFAFTGLLAMSVALLTVSYQAIKAALVNPVKSLRSE
jgi:ABC-type lipoprotein release transport system permease subunit